MECRRPHVFIFAVPGPCVRRYSELESCGTENNICLSQAPEEIVALARRGRGQIQRGRKKSAPRSTVTFTHRLSFLLAQNQRPQKRQENKCRAAGRAGCSVASSPVGWLIEFCIESKVIADRILAPRNTPCGGFPSSLGFRTRRVSCERCRNRSRRR